MTEEILEAADVGEQPLGKPVAEFARDRGVVGTRTSGGEEPSQPGALIRSPPRNELDLTSRQPLEIVQARDGLVYRTVVVMPLVEVDRGGIDDEVGEHRAQHLTRGLSRSTSLATTRT
ncbi:hypothetical protein ABN034_24685 [Actinopolymorpha sp. B11F2]|uniref:hypothetical protein n=1 Tax=Actinopolymorpha sp. B11F2 TaxID=3160862 RepID=UPI0032E45FE3